MKKSLRWIIGIGVVLVAISWILSKLAHIDMPIRDYDEAIQKKNSQIAKENVAISNYHENVVTIAGSTIPIGLDVSFDVTQKSSDYEEIYLDLSTEKNISLMDCDGVGAESGNYVNGYRLKPSGETEVHFRCAPRFVWLHDNPWLHDGQKDHICFRPRLVEELLVGNLKEYNDYRNPTADIDIGLAHSHPTQNTPIITNLVTPLMPTNANLRNEKFWGNIIKQSLQPAALSKVGYSKCFSTSEGTGWLAECYCKQ